MVHQEKFSVALSHTTEPMKIFESDIKDISVYFLQSAGNIRISCITAFSDFVLKLINANFCKNESDEFCQDAVDTLETCSVLIWKTLPHQNSRN